MKRFNIGKDDFTMPCKLTRQKHWIETPGEFVQLEYKAFIWASMQVVKARGL